LIFVLKILVKLGFVILVFIEHEGMGNKN